MPGDIHPPRPARGPPVSRDKDRKKPKRGKQRADAPTSESIPGAPAPEARYFNRDISWLEFNRRVLGQTLDDRVPLLERVKFLAIFASNLDEFFMKRVGLLRHRIESGRGAVAPGELPPRQVLAAVRRVILEHVNTQADAWRRLLRPQLADAGIHILDYDELEKRERTRVNDWFAASVFPILTPLAVDPGHRFPFISNLSENLGVLLDTPGARELKFARVKIPDVLPQFVRVDDPGSAIAAEPPVRLIALDDLVRHNLDALFPGLRIVDVMPFRLTRSASLELDEDEDDAEDLLEQVESELRSRRFASAVRIQVGPNPSPEILRFVLEELELDESDVYERPGPLAFADLFEVAALPLEHLQDPPWTPAVPRSLAAPPAEPLPNIFAKIREGDILLHHPYDSFRHSVERFIDEAAQDPNVLAIKQTIYRTTRDSPFVESLIEAAEDGKQVACLVELRARFDEEKNVRFARALEKAGVHVAYGVVGLKTHCKCSLVVRREQTESGSWGLRTYAHIGTGNYHSHTAQLYTDLGLFTCDPQITSDVLILFNTLTGHAAHQEYKRLLVAPEHMRARYERLIDAEIDAANAGRPARIIAKMNSLEDRKLTDRLYAASQAGVQIDLIIRGFCSLRPGVPGLSDNIRVRSIIGRFLEHSRVFYFQAGADDPLEGEFYISSGDWMYRNLNNRVEAACPIDDPTARRALWDALDTMLRDHRSAWRLEPDGSYTQLHPDVDDAPESPEALGTFDALMRHAAGADTPRPPAS